MEDGYMCFKGTRSPPQVLGPPDKQHISMATQQEHQSEKNGRHRKNLAETLHTKHVKHHFLIYTAFPKVSLSQLVLTASHWWRLGRITALDTSIQQLERCPNLLVATGGQCFYEIMCM